MTTTQVDRHSMSLSYVKGYTFDWDKIKSFVGTNDRKDRRIDFVMQQIMERLNHDHPVCSGRPRNELSRRRSVLPLNADTAFDDNLERLENKDIPIPRYLHEIAERLLSGPEVFVFDSW
ncbi:hypothetical protein AX14_011893 [Amanita brunnescens Koide BX004]|nr:hypothetical protein AX14_011893 [Amanita brunnescens Koide BX004]